MIEAATGSVFVYIRSFPPAFSSSPPSQKMHPLRFSLVVTRGHGADGCSVSASETLTFEKNIRPILKAHCFHCHGEGGLTEASLDVRLRRWIVAGGDSGGAVQPGEPDESLLLQRVASGEMPPGDKTLATDEVELIHTWISQGATTAREEPLSLDTGEYITEEERDFWAFQPIRRPRPPSVGDASIANPIDAFVLDKLQQLGLGFSDRADRYTLIRRATFDLWGLPPTPEMIDAFVADQRPDAYRAFDRSTTGCAPLRRTLGTPLVGCRRLR